MLQGMRVHLTSYAADSGLVAHFPMDEVLGDVVPSIGFNLTLMGAEIIPEGRIRGVLHVKPDINGYATGEGSYDLWKIMRKTHYIQQGS